MCKCVYQRHTRRQPVRFWNLRVSYQNLILMTQTMLLLHLVQFCDGRNTVLYYRHDFYKTTVNSRQVHESLIESSAATSRMCADGSYQLDASNFEGCFLLLSLIRYFISSFYFELFLSF